MTIVYLGTHEVSWLRLTDVPLFISRRRLIRQKSYPRAIGPWALDSGGFSELSLMGCWTVGPKTYADEVRRWQSEIGGLQWAAIQDWMCEPQILQMTRLTLKEHQRRTIESYLRLMDYAPDLPWVPVLQGWEMGDYLRHLDQYGKAGVELSSLPLVGIGSVCRRQHTGEVEALIKTLAYGGIKLHGFGFKKRGLIAVSGSLTSSDSLAWAYAASLSPPMEGCSHKHCSSCMKYALSWYESLMLRLGLPQG